MNIFKRIKRYFTEDKATRKERHRQEFGDWFFAMERKRLHKILKDYPLDTKDIKFIKKV